VKVDAVWEFVGRRRWIGAFLVVLCAGFAWVGLWASLPKYGIVVHYVKTDKPVVALTFDDGPHPQFTPQVLSILKQHRVPATFFMTGAAMEKHPELVARALREGHVIANHTYSHPQLPKQTRRQLAREVDKTEDVIRRFTRQRSHLLRPPYGMYNQQVCRLAREKHYNVVLWIVCAENREAPTPEAMARRVLERAKPGGVILAHDGSSNESLDRSRTVQSLPLMIEGLRKRGYEFVTVPTLLTYGAADNQGLCR
jgi:peptidoglycan/xylan/chitin deacetylase (PgdA/CDA1 family)